MDAPFRLSPSASFGPFALGDSLNQCIHLLRTRFRSHKTQILSHPTRPYEAPILLKIIPWSVTLFFSSGSQRLVKIEIQNPSALSLSFSNSTSVFGPNNVPTLLKLYTLLGPTYPGKREGDQYTLQYPGLWFVCCCCHLFN